MAAKPLPDVAYLRECFSYNAETGVLRWKNRRLEHFPDEHAWNAWSCQFAGKEAGSKVDRYVRVGINNRHLYAHRIIWAMQTGAWPTALIDHKNKDRLDNRWVNLREASLHDNQRNRPGWRGRTLPKGVHRSRGGRFMAESSLNGRTIYLGTFDTPEEAHAAYCAFASELHGEFFRGS